MFESKNAIVTGAAGDLGSSLCKALSESGWRVARIVRNINSVDARECSDGDSVFKCDLTDPLERVRTWREICDWTKNLDLLVNCAGVAYGAPAMMTNMADLKSTFEVNYFAPVEFSQFAARLMARKKNGVIINVLSIQALLSEPGNLAYGGSKAALLHATKLMASEFGKLGIRVNGVAPTVIKGKMAKLMDLKSKETLIGYSSLASELDVDEVVEAILFLASQSARNISGEILRIDGGMRF
ncbi:SDR family oxidoreductase [Litoricolaceae bacterium]|nr:SDR family oxidoreductase [Litorivicinaceae bacterium]